MAHPDAAKTNGELSAAQRRLLAVICLASILAVVNFAAATPFFAEIAVGLGTTIALLGQVTTAVTFISAALGLVVGPVADRFGHRRLMVAGVVAVAVNLLGTGLTPTYPVLLALAVVGGLGDSILFGLPLAIAGTAFAGAARRRAVAWTAAALPIGTIVCVPLLAAIGGSVGWRGAFLVAGLTTLATAWLTAVWLPSDRPSPDHRSATFRMADLLNAYRPLVRSRSMLVLYAVSGLRAACWIGLFTYLGAFLADRYGFEPGTVGLAYMAGGAGLFLGSLAAGRAARVHQRAVVAIGTIAQGALFATVFVQPFGPAVAIVLLPVTAFAGAFVFVGVANLLTEETPGGVATTMVLNGSVINLGTAIGTAAGGALLAVGGYGTTGIGLSAFAVAAGVLMIVVSGDRGPRRQGLGAVPR